MSQNVVTCGLCGHLFPERFVRERRSVTCVCGMRIDAAVLPRARHLRNLVCLLVAVTLVVLAASIARQFLG